MLIKLSRALNVIKLYSRIGFRQITINKIFVMLRYLFLTSICKKNIPWVAEFSITYNCQCKCLHCSVADYLNKGKTAEELTTSQCKDILLQIKKIGIPKVDFFGGEPLIRKDIIELSKFGASIGLFVSITTNALNITRDVIKELKLAKVSYVSISLDSADENKHDYLRGINGTYKKVLESVKFCSEEGLPCLISTYITRKDIICSSPISKDSNLEKIITLSKQIKASGIRILFPIISGKWLEDKEKAFTQIEQEQVLSSLDYSFAFIEGAYCVAKGKKVCQSLNGRMFNISPYGDVQLCVTYPRSFGNIKDKSLKDVLYNMYHHEIYLKNTGRSCCDTGDLIL